MLLKDLKETLEIARAARANLFLWGPPGTSKSAQVRQYAAERGLPFYFLQLSAVDPTDIVGHYVVDREQWVTRQTPPRVYRFFSEHGPGILFLDEFNTASEDVLAVALKLLDEKRLGDYVLPGDLFIVAAGNDTEFNASAKELSLAILTRFVHVELDADFSALLDYLDKKENSAAPEYVFDDTLFRKIFTAFARHCVSRSMQVAKTVPAGSRGALNLRTLEYAARIAAVCVKNNVAQNVFAELLRGCVGEFGFELFNVVQNFKYYTCAEIIELGDKFFSDLFSDSERLANLHHAISVETDDKITFALITHLEKYKDFFPQIYAAAVQLAIEYIDDLEQLVELRSLQNKILS